jgi:hypothetical protein
MRSLIILLLCCCPLIACESEPITPSASVARVDTVVGPDLTKDNLPTSTVPSDTTEDIMQLQFDSPYAEYYSNTTNKPMLKEMFEVLEHRISHFQQQYDFDSIRKVTVELYPDYLSMKSNLGYEPDVPFISGALVNDTILIQANNPEDTADIIIHEYTHFVLQQIGAHLPNWLNEGIAMYEGLQMVKDWQREISLYGKVRAYLQRKQPPSFDELDPPTYAEFVDIAGYEFGCVFVEYVISEFGSDSLLRIVQADAYWKSALDVDRRTLESDWHTYLLTHHSL